MSLPFLLEEMAEQPEIVARLLDAADPDAAALLAPPARSIVLTGCGDMRFAARAAASWARLDLGLPCTALPAMDLRWEAARLGHDDLVIGASISGRTPRTVEALRLARNAGARTLALTDNPGSPITREAECALLLDTSRPADLTRSAYAGYARPVPQTKTFLAALARLMALLALVGKRELSGTAAAAALRERLAAAERDLPALSAHLDAAGEFVVLGSGPYAPLAAYGAAKLLEYALPASAQCLEEMQHLEMFVANERTAVIVLAPDAASLARAQEIVAAYDDLGCRSLLLAPRPPEAGVLTRHVPVPAADLATQLLTLPVPLQRLAFECAHRRGHDVDRWVGGVREDLIQRLSLRLIRGSGVLGDPPAGA